MKLTQTEVILKYLRKGKSLTVLTAARLFQCFSLSQRCGDLRRNGYDIKRETVKLKSGKHVTRYSL